MRLLTDVVSLLQCAAVGHAGYPQVLLGPQTVQLVLYDVLSLSQR